MMIRSREESATGITEGHSLDSGQITNVWIWKWHGKTTVLKQWKEKSAAAIDGLSNVIVTGRTNVQRQQRKQNQVF